MESKIPYLKFNFALRCTWLIVFRQDISFAVDLGKDAAPHQHATTELVLKTYPEGTTNLGKSNPNASQADPTPLILEMMLALFVILTLVTYQTHTRQNPRMVMSLPLGISQYLGGSRYDPSCEIFELFQDSPYFTMP